MKVVVVVVLLALVATAHAAVTAPTPVYSAWGTCTAVPADDTHPVATCQQTRTVATCYDGSPSNSLCAYPYTTGTALGILDCQECAGSGTCGLTSLNTPSWQGVYQVEDNHCQPFIDTAPAPPYQPFATALQNAGVQCCCMSGKVLVRQYDELVEFTFPDGVTLSGSGCYITATAAAGNSVPSLANSVVYPRGISFKVVDPTIATNAATYNPLSKFKDTATGGDIPVTGTNTVSVPSNIKTAGQVTILGRTYRAIRTCSSIYLFGEAGFTSTDNPFCPQKLNYVGPLANN